MKESVAGILNGCVDGATTMKCLGTALAAVVVQVVGAQTDAGYWLVLSLNCFDFFCGVGVALFIRRDFRFARVKTGATKTIGYLLLMVPLLTAGHFLEGSARADIFEWFKNWGLFYMGAVEMGSVLRHLRVAGLPVPSPASLNEFIDSARHRRGKD